MIGKRKVATPGASLLRYAPLLPMIALVGAMIIYPVGQVIVSSLQADDGSATFAVYRNIAQAEIYRASIANTLLLACEVSAICLLFGYAIAYRMARQWSGASTLIVAILVLSFWTGLLIRSFAWMIILGKNGALNSLLGALGFNDVPPLLYNRTGALVGMVNIMLPFMVLTIYAVMRRVDEGLMRSAASLGASPFRAFWRVYFPLTLPGVWGGLLLVFVVTIGFYITPALLGGPRTVMISQLVAKVVQELLDFKLAGALSAVLLVLTLVLMGLYSRLVGGRGFVR